MNSAPEPKEGELPDEEGNDTGEDLCPACLTPFGRLAYFCPRCGAPVSSFASILPFERTLAEGYAYRQAVEAPRKFIVVAGIWVLFLPTALMCVVVLSQTEWRGFQASPENILALAIELLMFVVSVVLLTRTTMAYIRRRAKSLQPAET